MEAEHWNRTVNVSYTEFILFPFPGVQEARYLLALLFFFLFVIIVTANSVLIYTVMAEKKLHSPMCLLIALLLTVNLCGAATTFPPMLLSFTFHISRISLTGCLVQMFFLYFATIQDCNVLLMMALDRYVAICHPLRYADIMTLRLLAWLTLASLLRALSIICPVVVLASRVRFCRSNIISHFACEHMALMRLSCSDTAINKTAGLLDRTINIAVDLGLLLASYGKIYHTALNVASGNTRRKALHTCATHWIAISIGYFSRLSSSLVFRLARSSSQDAHNLISAVYLLFPWITHPVIYGARTKEIRESLLKRFRGKMPLPKSGIADKAS